jgi:coenzyme F420 biosynthesis associated uncharacterized protein
LPPDPIDWALAARIASRVGGRDPFASSYHYDSLTPDFERYTEQAEVLVSKATGLVSAAGPAKVRVTDRAGWVDANVASFQRLLRPITAKLGEKMGASPFAPVTRRMAGAELGLLLGWMSTRVLGQYDLLVIEDERPEEQDVVYYVGPNVLALEKRFAFPPGEFRLWLALHEITHRLQFTGIPWLRPHFLSLIERSVGSLEPDPKQFLDSLRRAVDTVRSGEDPLADNGMLGLFASPQQREVLGEMGGMMSLLEGHGDVTMDRAGADQIPSSDRFSRVLRERRQQLNPAAKMLQKVMGLEAKLNQYAQGEDFIEKVEEAGGPALLNRAFERPENLPSLVEIRSPDLWIDRIGIADSVA